MLAACLVAAFSCALPAFVVAPLLCGLALFVLQLLHQTWNFDGDSLDGGFLVLMAKCVLFCERTILGVITLLDSPVWLRCVA